MKLNLSEPGVRARWIMLPLALLGALFYLLLTAPTADAGQPADEVEICVTKVLSDAAQAAGASIDDLDFVLSSPDIVTGLPETMSIDEGSNSCFETFVPRSAQYTISEVSNGSVVQVPTSIMCGILGEAEDLPNASVTFTTPPNGPVSCTFTNDALVRLCVHKSVGATAVAAGVALGRDDLVAASFEIVVNDGVGRLDPRPAAQSDGGCTATSPGTDTGVAEFFLPPDTEFTIDEILGDALVGTAAPVGFVSASCGSGAVSTTGSVTANTSDDGIDELGCTFVNDAVRLCVHKTVGETAVAAGTALGRDDLVPENFEFTVTTTGGTSESKPALSSDGGCVARLPDDGSEGGEAESFLAGVAEFFVPAGADFTVTESNGAGLGPNAPIGLRFAACGADRAEPGSQSVMSNSANASVDTLGCTFVNDAARICVNKFADDNARAAGAMPGDFDITLTSGGQAETMTPTATTTSCETEAEEGRGTVEFYLGVGAEFVLQEAVPADTPVGLIRGACGLTTVQTQADLATRSISATASPDEGGNVRCFFLNDAAEITINKTVVNDDAGSADASAFIFDVFDGSGNLIASGADPDSASSEVGFVTYVAPGSTFTVTERPVDGYQVTTSECAAPTKDEVPEQALAADSITVELEATQREYGCSFTNDDLRMVPACARLTLNVEAEDTEFELADFTLELFDSGGASIGVQRSAGDPADPDCSTGVANLTPAGIQQGELVKLGDVFVSSGPFTFSLVLPADPDSRLVVGTSSCSLNPGVGSTQAIETPGAVTFSTLADTVLAACEITVTIPVDLAGSPVFGVQLPLPDTPAAAAAVPATQPVAVAQPPLAATGTTASTTLPLGFAALGFGFVFMALYADRRRYHSDR